MRGRELLDAIEYIDDELVEEAAHVIQKSQPDKHIKLHWKRLCHAAACMLILSVVSILAYQQHKYNQMKELSMSFDVTSEQAEAAGEDTADATGMVPESVQVTGSDALLEAAETNEVAATVIEAFPFKQMEKTEADQSVSCYAAPSKGNILIYHPLQQAINYYEAMDDGTYIYHIAIDIFGNRPDNNGEDTDYYGELISSEAGCEMLKEEYHRLLELGYNVVLLENNSLNAYLSASEIENFDALTKYGYAFRFLSD